ncbi:hypothetical protein [Methylosinus sp. Sm6]|uniref:hypothetical protein n=1 Tax=Methylosinus sp. Sm6 TaxID=2866948 RepID=UPI001C99BC94|nr:hypothetical protein [Methylosinus sp. Sm6]MBY6240920.1 hypothetical protein [Methylosinus sp. Sm6]
MTNYQRLLFAACALAGCNSAQPPTAVAPVVASRNVTPRNFTLPSGSGCAGAIARYRAVLDNDLAMGHVGQGVYATIQSELGPADSACSAGRDGEALSLLRASKSRHGYPG